MMDAQKLIFGGRLIKNKKFYFPQILNVENVLLKSITRLS